MGRPWRLVWWPADAELPVAVFAFRRRGDLRRASWSVWVGRSVTGSGEAWSVDFVCRPLALT